ncbi:MAG: hypothetical protein QXJ45_08245 [Thermoproteota archaeon]
MPYKKLLRRMKEILNEKPEIGPCALSFLLQSEGLIKSSYSFTVQETQELMNRLVKSWRVLYEDEKIRVEQEYPQRRVWFSLKGGKHWYSLGYMT